ncbi:MAG: molecular chaperone DnaJ [Phycisphaerae bacterium]|nr:molecular chaperone DnaJ [Phycisphaerae bacterium]
MPAARDYYEILGVEKGADGEEIKRAYRRMAMKFHPDRNPGDAEAETRFKEAAEAYEVLSDPATRQRYDQFGHEGLRGAGGPATHDFSRMDVTDIFSMFEEIFSGMGGGRARGRSARGFDLETEVLISFEDILLGCERDVEFTRLDVCEGCGGSGAKPGSKPARCAQCDGRGQVQQTGLGGMFRMVTACPACRGRGTIIRDHCTACKGKGRQPRKRSLSVRIPPGISDGQAVRIQGEGEPPPPEAAPDGAGMRGDLHVVVRIRPHKLYRRDADHLVMEMPIGITQAALGAGLDVPVLGGGSKPLTIPAGTQFGAVFRLTGEGLPNLRSGRRGDLITIVKVEVPRKLSKDQEKLLRQFAETEDEKVLPESRGFWDSIRDMLR